MIRYQEAMLAWHSVADQMPSEERKVPERMAPEATERLFPLELPLMYVAAQRSLTYVYAELDDVSALDRLQRALPGGPGALRASYCYRLPESSTMLAVLTIDLTEAAGDSAETLRQLAAVPGVRDVRRAGSGLGLAASEHHRLQVAGTPMVVMAREVLGGVFKSFAAKVEKESIYQTGIEMGRLAASAVPPLLERLGQPLTLDLLRQRLLDFQVFGWAEQVRRVAVEESLQGEIELEKTFEAAPWQGKAGEPTCHFIRGFTVGVFSFAHNRAFSSAEVQCQGKGDAVCRISFRPES